MREQQHQQQTTGTERERLSVIHFKYLAVLPLKLGENCWEADWKTGRSSLFDHKITVSLKACHKRDNLSLLWEMCPQRPSHNR